MAALSKNISMLLPKNLNKSFFLNSGAEAVEAAIKVCFRSYKSKKKNILFSNKSYHGKLIGSGSISGSYLKSGQFPIMENCVSFDFSDAENFEKKVLSLSQKENIFFKSFYKPISQSVLSNKRLYLPNDMHFNAYGFHFLAELVTEWVVRNPKESIGFTP